MPMSTSLQLSHYIGCDRVERGFGLWNLTDLIGSMAMSLPSYVLLGELFNFQPQFPYI